MNNLKNINDLPGWKNKLICWIAGDEPVLLNFCMMPKNTPQGMSLVIIPCSRERKEVGFYSDKAFLVPKKNTLEGRVMSKFRKKPVEVEAIKWTGDNLKECLEFLCESYGGHIAERRLNGRNQIIIKTSEGNMAANVGDYLIKEPFDKIRGFYPCKPDIFELTHEAV